MRFCKIIVSILLLAVANVAVADNVFGTPERPDPATEKVAVNTTLSVVFTSASEWIQL